LISELLDKLVNLNLGAESVDVCYLILGSSSAEVLSEAHFVREDNVINVTALADDYLTGKCLSNQVGEEACLTLSHEFSHIS
jgi:hypothetical protein